MDKNKFCENLVKLEASFPGVMLYLSQSDTRLFSALDAAHKAYTVHTLTDDEQARITALESAKTGLSALTGMDDAIKGINKQIAQIQGDYVDKAWKAYRSALSANGSSGKKTTSERDPYEGIVVRCPFGEGYTLYVQIKNKEQYTVWKVTQADMKEVIPLPDFLEGYTLSSLTSVRRLAWAVKNGKAPTNCHDGIGTRAKGKEGGSLAEIISHDPAAWATKQRKINSAKVKTTK